jgi:hypothetical protein
MVANSTGASGVSNVLGLGKHAVELMSGVVFRLHKQCEGVGVTSIVALEVFRCLSQMAIHDWC